MWSLFRQRWEQYGCAYLAAKGILRLGLWILVAGWGPSRVNGRTSVRQDTSLSRSLCALWYLYSNQQVGLDTRIAIWFTFVTCWGVWTYHWLLFLVKVTKKRLQEEHTFSISGPLYFVKSAAVKSQSNFPCKLMGWRLQATRNPETASSVGRANRNFFVLGLNISTLSSFRSIHPWSPPRKVAVGGFGSLARGGLLEWLWMPFGAAFPDSDLAVFWLRLLYQ